MPNSEKYFHAGTGLLKFVSIEPSASVKRFQRNPRYASPNKIGRMMIASGTVGTTMKKNINANMLRMTTLTQRLG